MTRLPNFGDAGHLQDLGFQPCLQQDEAVELGGPVYSPDLITRPPLLQRCTCSRIKTLPEPRREAEGLWVSVYCCCEPTLQAITNCYMQRAGGAHAAKIIFLASEKGVLRCGSNGRYIAWVYHVRFDHCTLTLPEHLVKFFGQPERYRLKSLEKLIRMASITQPVPTDGSVGIFTNAFDSAGQATISTWKASWSQGAQPWPQAITLYIPFSATEGKRAVNEKDLSAAFGPPGPTEPSTPFQVYVGNSEKAELQPSNEQIIVLNGSTLFAPVAPQSTTALSWFVEKLQAIVSEPPDTKSEAPDGQENPTNLVSQGPGTMSASGTQRATVSENGISTSGSSTPSCKVDVTSTPKFQGSVAGGIGGGILVGLIIGFLVWSCCYRRPRTRSSRDHLDSSTAVEPHLQPRHAAFAKETQIFEVPKSVVGWQKHLPQEKDDATVVRAVKALYDQIQIHIEGFYHAKQGKVGSQDTAILERYLSDSLPDSLSELPSDLSLLEGILVRRIVHRISLWSSTRQSLLPSECTKVPKRNEWHMETDDDNQVHTAESKKGEH